MITFKEYMCATKHHLQFHPPESCSLCPRKVIFSITSYIPPIEWSWKNVAQGPFYMAGQHIAISQ